MRRSRDRFRAGEILHASQMGAMQQSSRAQATQHQGSYVGGLHTSVLESTTLPPPWAQNLFYIGSYSSNLSAYEIRPKYLDRAAWHINTQTNKHYLDATPFDINFNEGDTISAFWHDQRHAWIPITFSESSARPFVEFQAPSQSTNTGDDQNTIQVSLEQSENGHSDWRVVSDRVLSFDTSVDGSPGTEPYAFSLTGIYTILAEEGVSYLRATGISRESSARTMLYAALRFEPIGTGETAHRRTLVSPYANDGWNVHNWRNVTDLPWPEDFPLITTQSNGVVFEIACLADWLIKIWLTVRFGVSDA